MKGVEINWEDLLKINLRGRDVKTIVPGKDICRGTITTINKSLDGMKIFNTILNAAQDTETKEWIEYKHNSIYITKLATITLYTNSTVIIKDPNNPKKLVILPKNAGNINVKEIKRRCVA